MLLLLPLDCVLDDEHVVNSDGKDEKRDNLSGNHGESDVEVRDEAHGGQDRGQNYRNSDDGESETCSDPRGEDSDRHPDVYEHCGIADDNNPHVLGRFIHQFIRNGPLTHELKVNIKLLRRVLVDVENLPSSGVDVSQGVDLEVLRVLLDEGAIVRVEFVD